MRADRSGASWPFALGLCAAWCLCLAHLAGASGSRRSPASRPIVLLRTASLRLSEPHAWESDRRRHLLSSSAEAMSDPGWGFLRGSHQLLVSLEGPVSSSALRSLDSALLPHGGRVVSYLPEDSVLVVGTEQALRVASRHEGVLGVGDFIPEHKVAPEWTAILSAIAGGGTSAGVAAAAGEFGNATVHNALGLLGAMQTDALGPAEDTARVLVDVTFPAALFDRVVDNIGANNSIGRRLGPEGVRVDEMPSPAAAAAAEWQGSLDTLCGLSSGGVDLKPEGDGRQLLVRVPMGCLAAGLTWLSEQPAVHWVAPRARTHLSNYQGISIMQTGKAGPAGGANLEGLRPLWAAGLNGAGQVIGCGDSGVDINSCYFHDPNVGFGASANLDAGGKPFFSSETHRKVRYYRFFGDGKDGNGHGTHVAASLLGKTDQSNWDHNNGMAPEAKLAFTDLGVTGSDSSGGIGVPGNLAKDYFPFAWEMGARIYSESWGSDSSSYDQLAYGVDLMAWANPEFLAVIAAGNFGGLAKDATINSPGTSKNGITVGATLTAENPSLAQVPVVRDGDVFRVLVRGGLAGDGAQDNLYNVQLAYFGPTFGKLLGTTLGLEMSFPMDACSFITNSKAIAGKVALVERGGCTFIEKVLNAQNAGAVAVLVANNGPSGSFKMTYDSDSPVDVSSIVIPSASVPRNAARPMYRALESARSLSIWIDNQQLPDNRFSNLAPFSSIGPTLDGRIKPDLVAPGLTISAGHQASPGQCKKSVLHGTSMATPLIGGGAALTRQYFMDGFYPTGVPVAEHRHTPGGALVKAVLIAGATEMSGTTPSDNPNLNGVPLETPPSVRQGFGRVNLGVSLPLGGALWRMQVVDQAEVETGKEQTYCVTATGGWLKIVLVWHDPPGDLAASKNLVNDLDLSVRSAGLGGASLLGNGDRDDTNNVEMLHLSDVPYGTVAITVSGYSVPQGPQPYALVVLGQFTGSLQGEFNPVKDQEASDVCAVVVAKVFLGPEGVTANDHPAFTFGAAEGYVAVSMFECRLEALSRGLATAQLHDWQPCQSPTTYRDLPDGAYEFGVRGTGEPVMDARAFVVDTTAPAVQVLSSPGAISRLPSATVAFSATDYAAVTFMCRLTLTEAAVAGTAPTALSGVDELGQWEPCTSPIQVSGLVEGLWELSVSGTDSVGNTDEALTASSSWRFDPDPSKIYTLISSAPNAVIGGDSALFEFQLAAAYPPAVVSAGLECKEEKYDAAIGPFYPYRTLKAWAMCSSPYVFTTSSDGTYRLRVRSAVTEEPLTSVVAQAAFVVRGPATWALFPAAVRPAGRQQLQVDSQPPVVGISSKPPALQTGPVATFVFSTSEPDAVTSCAVEDTDGNPIYPLEPCSSPRSYLGLADGQYVFSIQAEDQAGNQAAPSSYSWRVDSSAPYLDLLQATSGPGGNAIQVVELDSGLQAATDANMVTLQWEVSDGQGGTGVEMVFCSMIPHTVDLPPTLSSSAAAAGALEPSPVPVSCASPRSYWLGQGNYTFTMSAVDNAGNSAPLPPLTVVVDQVAPQSITKFGPDPSTPVASTVLLRVEALDSGLAPSGVAQLWGLLKLISDDQVESELSGSPDMSAPLPVELGGPADGLPLSGGAATNVDLLASDNGQVVQLRDVGRVELGQWTDLKVDGLLTSVIFEGLPTGLYSFRTIAVDAAGNAGRQEEAVVFSVDASLPLPLEDTLPGLVATDSSKTNTSAPLAIKLAIPIVCGLLLVAFFVFGVWRYRKHKSYKRRQRFLALRDEGANLDAEDGGLLSNGERDQRALAVETVQAGSTPDVYDVGPWRVKLDWAPLLPISSESKAKRGIRPDSTAPSTSSAPSQ